MTQIARKAAVPIALLVGAGVGATALDTFRDPIPAVDAQAAPVTEPAAASDLAEAFRAASRTALPGVVFISVEATPRTAGRQLPEAFRGTPFEDFFGRPGTPQPRRGSGSGFIISPDGYVLTNNHVVENATRVTVTLTDKRQFDAEVVGRDPNTDVAVLKVEGSELPAARLGNAEGLQVGDWVLALGYPLSLGETVTAGIVSAKGRNINILRRNEEAVAPLEHFIQTDAAINPGNSGGPLVNLRGEVVGINTAIASETGFSAGYGFAVPIHLAKRVADDLIQYGTVHRPKLGVEIQDVQLADVDVFGLRSPVGVVVKTVQEGPAGDAGIEIGDVIVAIDGEPVGDSGELMERVALRRPGDEVRVDLVRYGKERSVKLRLGAFDAEPVSRGATAAPARDAVGRLGFAASEMTPAMARELGLSRAEGVVVTGLEPGGAAAQAGLPRGMRLESINGDAIRTLEDLRKTAASLEKGGTVSIIGTLPDGRRTIVNYRLRG